MIGGSQVRVAIIGAGPAGLAAATALGKALPQKVWIFEKGRPHAKRPCPVDTGSFCKGCGGICNVISGFGGCIHPGDAIKLSRYPAGRRLKDLLGNDYASYEIRALDFFRTAASNKTKTNKSSLDRYYDVVEVNSNDAAHLLNDVAIYINDNCNLMMNTKVKYLETRDSAIDVIFEQRGHIHTESFDFVIVAAGRSGYANTHEWTRSMQINTIDPHPSFGLRFELPSYFLEPMYSIHKDYKESNSFVKNKVKTFCFSAHPDFGGRIKYCNYQDQFGEELIFLDGHMNADDSEPKSELGNFGLLAQATDTASDWQTEFLQMYSKKFGGKPFWQPLQEIVFPGQPTLETNNAPTIGKIPKGDIYELFPKNVIDDLIESLLFIMRKFHSDDVIFNKIIKQTNILAPCYEFFWDIINVNQTFESSNPRIYFVGDCAGIAQGNLQAAVSGLVCADGIIAQCQ